MSKDLMHILITKMHIRLNKLIEANDYNLLNSEVIRYSKRLDKVLVHYSNLYGPRADELILKDL